MESGKYAELCAHQDNHSGQTWIPIHDCPLPESSCKLLNRVVPNGTLRGVEGEGQISPIRLFFSISAIFIARTFKESPNRLMNPSASWWSYKSPVVNEAMLSLYKLYGEVVPCLMILPLYSFILVSPVTYS